MYAAYRERTRLLDSLKMFQNSQTMDEASADKMTVGVYEFKWSDQLGTGVFGRAYLAHHVNDAEEAVVRVVKKDQLEEEHTKRLFQRDKDVVMKLQRHRNIIKYLLDMEIGNNLYFVMEYCQHRSLEYYMKAHPQVEKITLLIIMYQCADIVSYIHSQDPCIIHWCIQPAVILLKGDAKAPEIKLVNYQYSVYFDGKENPPKDAVYGGKSKLYMAPEMFLDVEYDEKVDVFSLGCVFLAMINFHKGDSTDDLKPVSEVNSNDTELTPLGKKMAEAQKEGKSLESSILADDSDVHWHDVMQITLGMLTLKPENRSSAEKVKLNLQQILEEN